MTTTTEDRPRITRPGAGVTVDPQRVMTVRNKRLLTRERLSEKIRALGLTDDAGRPVTLGPDFLGKIETGGENGRRPGLHSFRALCLALECDPAELMPGGRETVLPRSMRERLARLDHNRDLRDFAVPRGLRYKNPDTGRVYYSKALRAAYAAWLALEAVRDGDEEQVRAAEKDYEAALARVPRVDGAADNEVADLADAVHDLIAS
jgi:hypothetical protein